MKDGPNIAPVAALIGDPARANMLTALMDGRALTASELANQAGITKQTASTHLAKLLEAGLIAREVQGRHRYFRLQDADVATALEALMGVAQMGVAQKRTGKRVRTGPRDPALRKARVCYNHLAGDLGVHLYDRLTALNCLARDGDALVLTAAGRDFLHRFEIDLPALEARKRPLCRPCLDWSLRRHHLAGSLGEAILQRIVAHRWARRVEGTRIIAFTPPGERAFRQWLD